MASRTGIRQTAGLLVSSIALVAIGVPAAHLTTAAPVQPPGVAAADAPAAMIAPTTDAVVTAVDPVTFVDMPPEFVELANWATGLFEAAELDLPPMRFVYHGVDEQECGGYPGHHVVEGAVSVIELCRDEINLPVKVLVVHEIAHAWARHSLTDERRAAFQAVRGWEHWHDYEAAEWYENGTEQAAEIMVWGLLDQPIKIMRINDASCDQLDAGYRALTGDAPLHGFTDRC